LSGQADGSLELAAVCAPVTHDGPSGPADIERQNLIALEIRRARNDDRAPKLPLQRNPKLVGIDRTLLGRLSQEDLDRPRRRFRVPRVGCRGDEVERCQNCSEGTEPHHCFHVKSPEWSASFKEK
jgi:hypothetical protein